jgi:hypothetical protein
MVLMTTTWTPKVWTQPGTMPLINVVDGKMFGQYAEALTGWGVDKDGNHTRGAGYGDRIAVIIDPATGNIAVVTHWEWNSPVITYIWTPEGLDRRSHVDPHQWMWDAVTSARHSLTWHAFKAAADAGTVRSYWTEGN